MTTSPNKPMEKQEFALSDALTRMFRACPTDPTEAVNTRLNHMLTRFRQYCKSTSDEQNLVQAEHSFESKMKMGYYKILEVILQQKCQRSGFKDVSSFLEDNQFQCAVMVCYLEIFLYTYKLPFGFDPPLCQIFSLMPYNLWEVISLVLQAYSNLTLDVTKHLKKREETIVKSLAWTRDSPLWEEIGVNEGQLPTCQQVMSPRELEEPVRWDQPDQDPQQADPTSDQQDSTLNRPQRSSRLYLFTREVYRLMAEQLRTLCSSLNLRDEQRMKIWACFAHSLVHHFDIMKDCHLNWLLLCAVHAITRNTKDEQPFKHIINFDNSMPHRSEHVCINPENSPPDNTPSFRFPTPNTPSVHVQEEDALTSFFSQVYMPAMEYFLKEFTPTPGGETPPLSPYPRKPPTSNRKYRVRNGCNIFVSHYNKETGSPQPPGLDYYFQSSPSQRLRDINNMTKSGRPPPKRRYALSMDEKDGDTGPSAKMPYVMGLSSLQRRLQDVDLDRMQCQKQDKTDPCSDQH